MTDDTVRVLVSLSRAEIGALIDLLDEEAERLDDDGNEGRFDASLLQPIYDRLKTSMRETASLMEAARKSIR